MTSSLPSNYSQLLEEVKARIRQARLRATLTANAELLQLYWQIGKTVLTQQAQAGWGAKIIDRLAADLRSDFPDRQGLSRRNLLYVRKFAQTYPDPEFEQRPVAQLPWCSTISSRWIA